MMGGKSHRFIAGLCTCAVLSVIVILSGCIRDMRMECPPMEITVTVKDKNYFNIDDAVKLGLMERKSDDLPFREYVSSLYYIVQDADGNVVAGQKNTPVMNNDLTQMITLPASLPYGKYTVTVWGNMTSDEPLGDDATDADMETNGAASNDIYMVSSVLDYQFGKEKFTLEMERMKGNLLVKAEDIPDNIDFSTKDIKNVYAVVDKDVNYSKLVNVHTDLEWDVKNEIKTETVMCPSPSFEGSRLSVVFYDKSSDGTTAGTDIYRTLEPHEVNITIGRNEIAILKYVYVGNGEFEIYMRINDNWELTHGMTID